MKERAGDVRGGRPRREVRGIEKEKTQPLQLEEDQEKREAGP